MASNHGRSHPNAALLSPYFFYIGARFCPRLTAFFALRPGFCYRRRSSQGTLLDFRKPVIVGTGWAWIPETRFTGAGQLLPTSRWATEKRYKDKMVNAKRTECTKSGLVHSSRIAHISEKRLRLVFHRRRIQSRECSTKKQKRTSFEIVAATSVCVGTWRWCSKWCGGRSRSVVGGHDDFEGGVGGR